MCLIKLLQRNRVIKPSLLTESACITQLVSILTKGASPQSTIFAQLRNAFSRVYGSHALKIFSWLHAREMFQVVAGNLRLRRDALRAPTYTLRAEPCARSTCYCLGDAWG